MAVNIWLYHINPKRPEGYSYGWDVNEPKTMLTTTDREWGANTMRRKVAVGDLICVYAKNMKTKPDGVYVVGTISKVDRVAGTIVWQPDVRRSAKLVIAPIGTQVVRSFFGRSYGNAMQRLEKRQASWLSLIGPEGEVVHGVPIAPLKSPAPRRATSYDPVATREHGGIGERFVLRLLQDRFPRASGYSVIHVAAANHGADHDIAVRFRKKLVHVVEVKTRVGAPDDPVMISEAEMRCRASHKGKHIIFLVYLNSKKTVSAILEIGAANAFTLSPRQHWLRPVMK